METPKLNLRLVRKFETNGTVSHFGEIPLFIQYDFDINGKDIHVQLPLIEAKARGVTGALMAATRHALGAFESGQVWECCVCSEPMVGDHPQWKGACSSKCAREHYD